MFSRNSICYTTTWSREEIWHGYGRQTLRCDGQEETEMITDKSKEGETWLNEE